MKKAARHLMPIVIAVALGPLIAGLAFGLLMLVANIFEPMTPMTDLFVLAGAYTLIAYIVGYVIALLAGILVSIWMIWSQPNVLVAIGAAVIATSAYVGLGATGLLGPVEYVTGPSNFWVTLTLAVIAAAGCW